MIHMSISFNFLISLLQRMGVQHLLKLIWKNYLISLTTLLFKKQGLYILAKDLHIKGVPNKSPIFADLGGFV